MKQVIARLSRHIDEVPQSFRALSAEAAATRPAPGKWSSKEILGHLCDSAVNNLGRFVRAQTEQPYSLIGYQQDEWVKALAYQDRSAEEIVSLWSGLNRSIVTVMSTMPTTAYAHDCILPDGNKVTLEWLMTDYVEHMEHHLDQLFSQSA